VRPVRAGRRVAWASVSLTLVACAGTPEAPASVQGQHGQTLRAVTAESMAAPTRFLAHDLLEGRGPGTRGDQLAIEFVATEFQSFGLKPGGADGSYYQPVPLVGLTANVPKTVEVTGPGGKGSVALSVPDDLVVMSGVQKPSVDIAKSELVFVGFGIVAPEYQWDDYKDVDVRGKTVVVMNSDPEDDPSLFAGKTRLWYGRWDYKYLEAARHGAVGAIVIHTTPSAGYPWQVVSTSNAREKFELPAGNEPRLQAKMWATEEATRRLVALGGDDLDALRKAAQTRAFRPKALASSLSLAFTSTMTTLTSANVLGLLPGSDAALAREVVIYTAHHDHFGIGTPKNGDAIYNGAIDNASGTGELVALARAASLSPRPRRSMLFIAVTAEEQGLLGSEYYAEHPTFPTDRIAADLNMDGVNVNGRTTDVAFVGLGKSSLDDVVQAVAAGQGRKVHGDAFPDRGGFYRSDQFSFAKVGVPSIYVSGGPGFEGRPAGWGEARVVDYETHRYHQPSDEYDPSWDWSGAVQDAELLLHAGFAVANADAMPAWHAGDEFAKVVRSR
jgi:Zn-dependent M28 family amino/carboxypeptidase